MARAADCPAGVTPPQLSDTLGRAEASFDALDLDGFDRSMDEAALQTPCLSQLVTPALAALTHRMYALRLFLAEAEGVTPSLRAARSLQPDYVLPPELLPPDHELRVMYEAQPAGPVRTRRVPEPREGALAFDGTITRERPRDQATLLQRLDADGEVSATAYLAPNDPLPDYRAIPRTRNRLLLGCVSTAVVAGVLYGASHASNGAFYRDDPDRDLADLERIQARTNALSWGAAGLGLGAAGLGAAAIAVGER